MPGLVSTNAINNIVSYYNKGAVIAMCLDLLMRQQSNGEFGLDILMQQLWQRHGAPGIGTDDKVIHRLLSQYPQLDLGDFLHKALYTTEELPVAECLAGMGIELHLRPSTDIKDKGGKVAEKTMLTAFGASYSEHSCGVKITQVREQTPAYNAGLQVGDQLIAIGNWQVNSGNLQQSLDRLPQGESVTLTLLRDQKLKQYQIALQSAPLDTVYLSISDTKKASRWVKPVSLGA